MGKNEKHMSNQLLTWLKSPILHYPLWLIIAWISVDHIGSASDFDAIIYTGLFFAITGLWGVSVDLFFLRIPWLGKYIYDNNYVFHANIVIIVIGLIICAIAFVTKSVSLFF